MANPIRFSSKYQDEETGFNYYGYRFYSSAVGRWINCDPMLAHHTSAYLVPYEYVAMDNAVYNAVDPDGRLSLASVTTAISILTNVAQLGDIFDPASSTNTLATVVCNGPNLEIAEYNTMVGKCSGIRACARRHEQIHINYLKRRAPNICKGNPAGIKKKVLMTAHHRFVSEHEAWSDTARCLNDQLKACDSTYPCRSELIKAGLHAVGMRDDFWTLIQAMQRKRKP